MSDFIELHVVNYHPNYSFVVNRKTIKEVTPSDNANAEVTLSDNSHYQVSNLYENLRDFLLK